MYKLNGNSGDKTGLGITVKVMSGDNVMIYGKSFWHTNGSSPTNSYTLAATDLLTLLAGTPLITGANKVTAGSLTGSTSITNGVSNWLNNAPATGTAPKAYLNWILFDEQFKPVSASSGFDAISSSTDDLKSHAKNVDITKNGYLYVYASNESDVDVFFDNLQLIHNHGPLLEETHYYPFGLTMAGISSKASGKLENRFKYNGNKLESGEFSDGSGLEMYDFNARTYDQQIGRFMQIDPLADEEDQETHTPYHFGFNNPVLHSDPDGKNPIWGAYRAIMLYAKIIEWVSGQAAPAAVAIPTVLKDATLVARSAVPLDVKREVDKANSQAKTENKSSSDLEKAQERANKLSEKERPSLPMTKAGKKAAKEVNKAKNEGKMRCENWVMFPII
ncbi:RHS repeat domain-containing protein [Sediminibacterium ginsengisoli]|uniref:RHS repeat-associated core domain-containing protein n=1 Tax=Sediminibacterium ginsengisoli TaxID=413434 RepID=A0A1T4P349_9BACT|nr:RHS repeat-associated core domain-containing protein [Sediminibacterium ginsengisoli]SJZ85842.1 RHS repeat-associated core domain-containing protein [Sediminibacterium ginsengisoli]